MATSLIRNGPIPRCFFFFCGHEALINFYLKRMQQIILAELARSRSFYYHESRKFREHVSMHIYRAKLRTLFVEQQVVLLQNFRVMPTAEAYKPVPSGIKLQFWLTTAVEPAAESNPPIPLTYFDFADVPTLEGRKGNNSVLTDVIGRFN